MKVLSLLQPWATLVVIGAKRIETRSWNSSHRGELLIHASRGKAGGLIALESPFKKYIPEFSSLPFGSIIGKVTLEDIFPIEQFDLPHTTLNELTLEERAFGDYTAGRYGWIFSNAEAFETPIPARGHLYLWEVEE